MPTQKNVWSLSDVCTYIYVFIYTCIYTYAFSRQNLWIGDLISSFGSPLASRIQTYDRLCCEIESMPRRILCSPFLARSTLQIYEFRALLRTCIRNNVLLTLSITFHAHDIMLMRSMLLVFGFEVACGTKCQQVLFVLVSN